MSYRIPRQNKITPDCEIPVGFAIKISDQRYHLACRRPHVKADGTATELNIWVSHCADCGEQFEAPQTLARWPQIRRCDLHKAAGKRA